MAEKHVYKTPRQKILAFRGMLVDVCGDLSKTEVEKLAGIYDEKRVISSGTDLITKLVDAEQIRNCECDLIIFGDNLVHIKRNDLKNAVDNYIQRFKPKLPDHTPIASHHSSSLNLRVSSTADLEEDEDHTRSTVSAIGLRG